jgi:hypothetical protein
VSLLDLLTGETSGSIEGVFDWVEAVAFSRDGSRLAVSGLLPIALVCDVATLCGKVKDREQKTAEASAEQLEDLWAAVVGTDSAEAYRAILRLGLTGPRGALFLKERLKGVPGPDDQHLARLIAELDADDFAIRERATKELERLGTKAEPALRKVLQGQVSAEARSRVTRLLERLGQPQGTQPSSELVRLRIVEALEANATPEARKVLEELSAAAVESATRQEAKASVERPAAKP